MSKRSIILVKILTHILCLLPAAKLVYGWLNDDLGANPIERLLHRTGIWAIAILCISLTITPLRYFRQLNWLIQFRRLLGMYAFVYALAHFAIYIGLDQEFEWRTISKEISKRPFVTVGFASFVLLVPLAATSTKFAIKLLTGRRWNLLHRLVYPALILAVVHFWWLTKKDITDPALYALAAAVLLGVRLAGMLLRKSRNTSDKKPNAKSAL